MTPRMTPRELALFRSFVVRAGTYLEFGAGGSTVVAAEAATERVISVDSSQEWLANVAKAVGVTSKLTLHRADIGPTGDWGVPTDMTTKHLWPSYHSAVWENPLALSADTVMVDGRFRVACFLQTVLRAAAGTIILVHDFTSRPQYYAVREVAREIATDEDLSAFVVDGSHASRRKAAELMGRYRLDVS